MNSVYKDVLVKSIKLNKPKLFFSFLAMWNARIKPPKYLKDFSFTDDEVFRIIKLHYRKDKLRPLIKRYSMDVPVSCNIRTKLISWELMPAPRDFSLRNRQLLAWIDKNIEVGNGQCELMPYMELPSDPEALVAWYFESRKK